MNNYNTTKDILSLLEYLRKTKTRVRIWFGSDNKVWAEEYDILGYIGKALEQNHVIYL